jgi:phosphohistidine phosphatase
MPDFERPLARRGEKEAPRAGERIKEHGWMPDYVLSSPALRARDTTKAITRALDLPDGVIHFDDRIYMASRAVLLRVLTDCPAQARRVLLVGHNPGLDDLLEYLAESRPARTPDGKLLTTAAVACLETDSTWTGLKQGSARLVGLLRPRH